MKPTPEELKFLQQRVREVPFLGLLGVELEHVADGEATMSLVIEDKHLQTMGIAHGGVIATLLDSVTWWAGRAAQDRDDSAYLISADLKVNYLGSLKGGKVTARGICKKSGSRLYYAVAELTDGEGRLVADGSSTLLVVQPKS